MTDKKKVPEADEPSPSQSETKADSTENPDEVKSTEQMNKKGGHRVAGRSGGSGT
jgi:hypothetical protein